MDFTKKEIELLLNILSQVQIPLKELDNPNSTLLGVRDRLLQMKTDMEVAEHVKPQKLEDAVKTVSDNK